MYTIKHAQSKQCKPLHKVLFAVSVTVYLPILQSIQIS